MTPQEEAALARGRFAVLNFIKVIGVIIMIGGLANVALGFVEPRELIGWMLFAVGFIDALIVPQMLVRKWRTPPRP